MKDIKTYLIKESLTSAQERQLEDWFIQHFGIDSLDVDIKELENDDEYSAEALHELNESPDVADELAEICIKDLKINKSLKNDISDWLAKTADYICY